MLIEEKGIFAENEHPVSDAMRRRIERELDAIERAFDVKILYACESGSRGWGFASTDSDYDVRFIYVHKTEWYLKVEPGRDVIERPLDDELDISGWELRKALGLLKRSNPTLLEWLNSPIVYRADEAFMTELRQLAVDCFSGLKGRYHYLSMAKKNFRGYLKGDAVRLKKYFYVLRPLLAVKWIDERKSVPPMPFSHLLTVLDDKTLLAEIDHLLESKRKHPESKFGNRLELIHRFIEQELDFRALEMVKSDMLAQSASVSCLDRFLSDTVMRRS
ncbi:nucleotidyltransferase domain-containing protein [Leminorella grimontii]|uniref:nucleotidyltransferase domain-containing protein n=1 Tax=Leminorella grimontii TaxID=82981 RepID=UPI0032201A20